MAQVTFTIPDTKIQHFIDCFGEDYQSKVDGNTGYEAGQEPHQDVVGKTQAQYAKDQAFIFLAERVRKWTRQQAQNNIQGENILI